MKTIKFILTIIISSVVLLACNSTPVENKEEEKQDHDEHSAKTVEITAEQFKTVNIETGTIEQKNLSDVIKANGYLRVPPEYRAEVTALMGGVIKSILVKEGELVQKGQLLAMMEHPDFLKLQNEYISAKSNFNFLEKEYQRQQQLFKENISAGKTFQKTESEYLAQKGNVQSLESQLKMIGLSPEDISKGLVASYVPVKSPIDGYVGHIEISIGTYAETNKMLFQIVDNTKIYLDLLVYEKDLFKVKPGQEVGFVLANLSQKIIKAEVKSIGKTFEGETKSVSVRAELIDNDKANLISGMYVNALIETGMQKVLAVPQEAVVKSDGREYIFVVAEMHKELSHEHAKEEKNAVKEEVGELYTFQMEEVITGITELGYVEIKPVGKLSENAKVVVKNAFFLLSQKKVSEGGDEE